MYSAAASSSSSSEPYFRSHARTYRIKIGDSVTLSCNVENLGEQTQQAAYGHWSYLERDPGFEVLSMVSMTSTLGSDEAKVAYVPCCYICTVQWQYDGFWRFKAFKEEVWEML